MRDPGVARRVVGAGVGQADVVGDVAAGHEQAALGVEGVARAEGVVIEHGRRRLHARERVPEPRVRLAARSRDVVAIPEHHLARGEQVGVDGHSAEVDDPGLPLSVLGRAAAAQEVQVVHVVVGGEAARAPRKHQTPRIERGPAHEHVVHDHLGRGRAPSFQRDAYAHAAGLLAQPRVGVHEGAAGHVGGRRVLTQQRAVPVQRDVVVVDVPRVLVDVEADAQ